MQYRQMGTSGVMVSVVGLGGNTYGRYCDADQTAAVIHRALDLGINHVDTADMYSSGVSEEFVGRAIADRRDRVVLATKTGFPMGQGPNDVGLSRRRIIDSVEASLRRLGTDYIDLYYLHRPDPITPIEESLRTLDDLVRDGKIRYGAVSNYAAWRVAEMVGICARESLERPVVSQNLYNMLDRGIEAELVPACRHFGMSVVPFSPLAGGFLTGKYRRGEEVPAGVRGANNPGWQAQRLTDRNFAVVEALERFATGRGHTMGELAIAWLLARPVVCSVIAGVTRPEQVEANAAAADWVLNADDLIEIDRLLDGGGAA
ncbi:MAG TPA: aldo/keto reductase [Thermomicrobiaceae bacterium]|nr:aldo/keto reductase [Thermomicrobiaceae bacterium]